MAIKMKTVSIISFNELVDYCKVSVRKVHSGNGKSEDLLRHGYLEVPENYVSEIVEGWQVVGKKRKCTVFC